MMAFANIFLLSSGRLRIHLSRINNLTFKKFFATDANLPRLLRTPKVRSNKMTIDQANSKMMHSSKINSVDDVNPIIKRMYRNYDHRHQNISADDTRPTPVKIIVKKPRREPVKIDVKQCYCMGCHVLYEYSDKYTLHKLDPSVNVSTENLRPTVLEVMIPVQKPSELEKMARLQPNILKEDPVPKNNNKPYKI